MSMRIKSRATTDEIVAGEIRMDKIEMNRPPNSVELSNKFVVSVPL